MEKDDLKLLWKKIHLDNASIDETEIKECMNMKHSKIISNILSGQKKEMFRQIVGFTLFVLGAYLIFHSFVFSKINFSFVTIYSFSFALGIFIFFKTAYAIRNFIILSRKAKNMPIEDSIKSFSKMLKKILLIDFLANTVYFYTLAVMVIVSISKEREALSNLNLFIPIICLISILFLIPWFLKWSNNNNKRYKRFFSDID